MQHYAADYVPNMIQVEARRCAVSALFCNRLRPLTLTLTICAALLSLLGTRDARAVSSTQAAQDACAALSNLKIPAAGIGLPTSGATVQSTTLVSATADGNSNGEYCKVLGVIAPVDPNAPGIEFEVNLPSRWNMKALQMGGGGYDGTLVTGLGGEGLQLSSTDHPLKQGYVTLGSDGGHHGGPGFDGTFALNDEALLNYGRQSIKKTHDVAVAIIQARYGARAKRHYFIGNSQGGHEALDAAARYPTDYDGVIANYPAYNVMMLHLGSLNVGKAIYADGGAGWLNPSKVKLLTDAAVAACDQLDGAKDGVISNIAACNRAFNIDSVRAALRCADGKDAGDACLSDAQIDAVRKITSTYSPGFSIAGSEVFPRWPLLEGSKFQIANFGKSAVPLNPPGPDDALLYIAGAATVKYVVTRDPQFNALTFEPSAWKSRIQEAGAILDVTDIDLTPFRRKGGKIIMTHGTEDEFITPHNSDAYYERHLALQGRRQMDSFVRYYKVPGFSHGFGTFNAKYAGLATLDAWVDRGVPPGILIATDENPGSANRTRPMCPYPKWPKFTGRPGATLNDAANFTCVAD
jgi:pimeloyl-ACP methyl ester carboxylesterase